MGNYFNDDEFQGVETVKISANSKRNKGAKMVGGVPMATIYQGMSIRRWRTLSGLENEAYDNTYNAWFEGGRYPHADEREFNNEYEAEFRRLCERAAVKAGWHANKRAEQNQTDQAERRLRSAGWHTVPNAERNNHPTSKTNKKGK
jgi:hypothetical protein